MSNMSVFGRGEGCGGRSLATHEEGKIPRHPELHQKIKVSLLPNLRTIMADSTRLFFLFLGAKGWLYLYFFAF